MNCPTCGTAQSLTVGEIAPDLDSYRCTNCLGNWVRLEQYLSWRDRSPNIEATLPVSAATATDPGPMLRRCPDCSYILARYRVASDASFLLDRCRQCHGVWFDRDEWQLVEARGLALRLADVFSDEWQRDIRQAEQAAAIERMFENRLGSAEWARAREVRDWVNNHPKKRDVLAYLELLPASPSREPVNDR
jgi:Zn-finger nucleic acid-binding protein